MIERVNSAQFAIYLAAGAAAAAAAVTALLPEWPIHRETEIEGRIIIKQKSLSR